MIYWCPSIPTVSYRDCHQRNSTTVRTTLTSLYHHTLDFMYTVIIAVSAAFIEQRRRALKRFLLLVVRHPILAKDDITKIFLSAGGQVRKN